jgi:hypothetical protein
MDIQGFLDAIEDELNQELEVTEESRGKAQQAVERSMTLSTPVRRFYERYRDGNNDKRLELFDDWRLRFLNRARGDPGAKAIRRRFMQYLRLGANSRSSAARTAAREGYISSSGGIRKIQYLLGKGGEQNMPEYLWVVVYVTKIQPISERCRDFVELDDMAGLMTKMVYVGHRRDNQNKRDSVRISDAKRRGTSDNGLTQITRHYLDNDMVYNVDFRFDEVWNLEVLGLVDHGSGLEASNALDASVIEDLKRIEVIYEFLLDEGPRPLNSKIDNALLGVTNIRGLLRDHDTPLENLDRPKIRTKLRKAQKKLQARYDAYKRRFIRDENGDRVLPVLGTTRDGIGQTRTAEFNPNQRKNILRGMIE